MKQFRLLLIFTFLAYSNVYGQTAEYENWLLQQKLPEWTIKVFNELGVDEEYKISNFINPFYLEADFNGDNYLDAAIAVEHRATKMKGFIIFHGSSGHYFVFGAGVSFGNGGDDFKWMNIWKVNRSQSIDELTFDSNSEITGSQEIILHYPGIDVIKSESAGGLIYWNGKEYIWAQTSD